MKRYLIHGVLVIALAVGLLFVAAPALEMSAAAEPPQAKPPAPVENVGESANAGAALYIPGTYEGEGQGFGGKITASVTVDETSILSVEAEGNGETAGIGTLALEKLPDTIIAQQSAQVDAVSGASFSSAGLLEAVENALQKAAA